MRIKYSELTKKDKLILDKQNEGETIEEEILNTVLPNINDNISQNGSIIKIISILSMIGSSFWILTFLYLFFEISEGFRYVFIFFIIVIILKFWGALIMYKLKKSGFVIYSICNIIFTLLLFFSILNGDQQNNLLFAWAIVILSSIFLTTFYNYKNFLIY